MNRPFVPPCAEVALDDRQLARWRGFATSVDSTLAFDVGTFLVGEDLVYCSDANMLGMRTNEALRALLEHLDEMDCAEVRWRE